MPENTPETTFRITKDSEHPLLRLLKALLLSKTTLRITRNPKCDSQTGKASYCIASRNILGNFMEDITEVIIEDGVDAIGARAFQDCSNLCFAHR